MPLKDYTKLTIGGNEIEVTSADDLPIAINYSLEDEKDFQVKTSGNVLNLKVPATLLNDRGGNTFRNPDVADLTLGQVFRNTQPCLIESNGYELFAGQAILENAVHNDKPKEYNWSLYGDNADWILSVQETTLFDLLKTLSIPFDKTTIMNSWTFDGRDESLSYVFAPVRYKQPFNEGPENLVQQNPKMIKDYVVKVDYLRPSISIYYLIYWGFKSIGYRIDSKFFETDYFRRLVMPWTWGSFLSSEGTAIEVHRFRAVGEEVTYIRNNFKDYVDTKAKIIPAKGGFDNNGDYTYDAVNKAMIWEYKTNNPFGNIKAHLSIQIDWTYLVHWNCTAKLTVQWIRIDVNGIAHDAQNDVVYNVSTNSYGVAKDSQITTHKYEKNVDPGDKIMCRLFADCHESTSGELEIHSEVLNIQMDYFTVELGTGTVLFETFTSFKKYKFLDFFAGVTDAFNLSFNTDSFSKVVVIEPSHPYSLTNDLSQTNNNGYFVNDFVDWNGKEDLSQDWIMDNYNDYDREVMFKFKDDTGDGILKKITDRNTTTLAAAKYVFSNRFQKGKKQVENRFFSPLMHADFDRWQSITGQTPQIPVIIPENISNTSQSEADNTFQPKLAFYKGNIPGVGGWRLTDGKDYSVIFNTIPFMFSVNYINGIDDPILSYGDEKIGAQIGHGLVKRFFWQRIANMRNGQWYSCWFRLKNSDVANNLHREFKSYKGHRWELVNIKNFKPTQDVSTSCLLRRWAPVEQVDHDNTYPSSESIINNNPSNKLDLKYAQLKCLGGDISTGE